MLNDLVVKYTHFEKRRGIRESLVIIKFDERYPARWMKQLFELKYADATDCSLTICEYVMDLSLEFIQKESNEIRKEEQEEPKQQEEHWICNHCYSSTLVYLDIMCARMHARIRKSVIELMLCLKRINLHPDMVKFIGKIAWDTKLEMEWIKLDPIAVSP